jgi:hypothetical protein
MTINELLTKLAKYPGNVNVKIWDIERNELNIRLVDNIEYVTGDQEVIIQCN